MYVVVSDKADMEVEARQAVSIIRDMTDAKNPMLVAGKNEQDEDIYRPAQYRDIVILVRSVRAVGQLIFDVLSEAGIPVVMEQTQGFFDTREISLMTSILEVIDNPRQDFPLAAVLVGPMFGFTGEEMAKIRSESRDVTLYESLFCVTEEKLKEKIDHFLSVLEKLRDKKSFATVAELMEDIYEETGIYRSVRMMTDGVRRAANMDRLMEIAREFDATTYHGLYQFVRYIRRIREQQEEMGEVNIAGEEENVVRIMTIHKSKGLEFPIVFLLGMGKKLTHVNRSFLTIHPELGVAAPLCDTKKHTKKTTLYQSFLARKNRLEDLGEELRVLYVAMTRAEEKLVMIGTAPEKKLEANGNSYWERSRIESYLDMVLAPALSEQVPFRFHIAEKEELVEEVATELVTAEIDRTVLNNFDTDIRYHEDVHELLERMVNTFEEDEPLPVKVSVSDLKMKSMEELEDTDLTILSKEEISEEMPVPMFMQEKEAEPVYAGATYGTVWHQVMASIDFGKTNSESEIKEAVSELVRAGKLRPEETKMLNYRRLYTFFRSNLGKEMTNAWENGTLHSEQPFVIGRPAYELFPDRKEDKTVLVQGIIDGYYEKDGKIVLMDYKTDSLKSGEEGKLAERYKKQMDLYKQALEMILGKKVETCVLYSFSLGKEIEL